MDAEPVIDLIAVVLVFCTGSPSPEDMGGRGTTDLGAGCDPLPRFLIATKEDAGSAVVFVELGGPLAGAPGGIEIAEEPDRGSEGLMVSVEGGVVGVLVAEPDGEGVEVGLGAVGSRVDEEQGGMIGRGGPELGRVPGLQ